MSSRRSGRARPITELVRAAGFNVIARGDFYFRVPKMRS